MLEIKTESPCLEGQIVTGWRDELLGNSICGDARISVGVDLE